MHYKISNIRYRYYWRLFRWHFHSWCPQPYWMNQQLAWTWKSCLGALRAFDFPKTMRAHFPYPLYVFMYVCMHSSKCLLNTSSKKRRRIEYHNRCINTAFNTSCEQCRRTWKIYFPTRTPSSAPLVLVKFRNSSVRLWSFRSAFKSHTRRHTLKDPQNLI